MRTRLTRLTLALALITTTVARAVDSPYYLALGDSLAFGVQPTGQVTPTNQGYVDAQ
jgi:hypothetical protein